jgi:replicative DNA helicase
MPVYSMADIEPRYHSLVTLPDGMRVDLARWLPSFRNRVRPLTPGAVVLIQGDTGIGKTMILQNIAACFHELKTLFFEMELPDEDLYERFWSHKANLEATEIEREYKDKGCFGSVEIMKQFPNLFICPESRLSLEQFEAILVKSELKMGGKPVLVMVDYAQLVIGKGDSRYERASSVAEGIKVVAKATQTVIFVASQIDRESAKKSGVGLHSAKDSGSLENSAGLVIGAHRDDKDATLMHLRILKATKGGAGLEIKCNIDGARSRITERSPVSDQDVPTQ